MNGTSIIAKFSMSLNYYGLLQYSCCLSTKLRSEIVWHRFFAVPAFMRNFRSYIAVRKLLLETSPNFSSRFRGSACFWQSPDILRKIRNFITAPTD